MHLPKKIALLGSGELGKEVAIAAKRLGCEVIAIDRYANAPAMQVADSAQVIDMLDGDALEQCLRAAKPDLIVPEVEAIRTQTLAKLEQEGFSVVPNARATQITMDRQAIRDIAAKELGLRTAKYAYAHSLTELEQAATGIGYPCIIKPLMSSSGKGQSKVLSAAELVHAWQEAITHARGDQQAVIIEEFIQFDLEITLLTIRQHHGETLFLKPIGHTQENGDYRESWQEAELTDKQKQQAEAMALKVTDYLGGVGLFGVEFFITKDEVIFSELSPRPHDTGMVTLISQNLSEFDLHVRAILGLPIPNINYYGASASCVLLATQTSEQTSFHNLDKALMTTDTDIRLFAKPKAYPGRRLGVVLARGKNVAEARKKARAVADVIDIEYSIAI